MTSNNRNRRVVPVALGVVLLAIVVAAGLAPNTGAVSAQGNCEYGQCVANTGIQWWVLAAIVIVVVAALGAALVLLRRRRSPPRSGMMAAPPPVGPTGGVGPRAPPPPPPAAAPAYLETPDDIGRTLPNVPTSPPAKAGAAAGGAAGAGAAGTAAEGEPDIDSLMAELDKISGEILKRPKSPTDKKSPPSQ